MIGATGLAPHRLLQILANSTLRVPFSLSKARKYRAEGLPLWGACLGALLITGLATGVVLGLLRWGLFLRGRLLLASLWLPIVAIAWPVGWIVIRAVGVDVERGYAVFGSTGALVFAAITGLAMLLMLRGRTR